MNLESAKLREQLVESLERLGFTFTSDQVYPPTYSTKESIREMYMAERKKLACKRSDWIDRVERRALKFFATGDEVEVKNIRPRLEPVMSSLQVDVFRYACLLWSIPVSPGYGRRMRFLVFDESNGKLIGLFALGDPVYNLRVRDQWIKWTVKEKNERLYHVMDAYVLGAVPPYSYLLGGKLVAMATACDEVRNSFRGKYGNQASVIKSIVREPHLVLITTTSALGRSSVYNRISYNGRRAFISLGFTQGWGHFHFANGTFEQIKAYMRECGDPVVERYKYGGGPNWRFRVVKRCLVHLGLSTNLMNHGIKREVFVIPLAENTREFLRGEDAEPSYYSLPTEEIFSYFRERWLLPRAARDQRYRTVTREHIRKQIRGIL